MTSKNRAIIKSVHIDVHQFNINNGTEQSQSINPKGDANYSKLHRIWVMDSDSPLKEGNQTTTEWYGKWKREGKQIKNMDAWSSLILRQANSPLLNPEF